MRRSTLRRAAAALALLAALVAACGGEAGAPEDAPRLAPDFEQPDLDGNPVRLSELRGRTVLIDFWATWCMPCVFQPPELNKVWRAHRESGRVAVLGVEVGGASPEEIRRWGEVNDAVAEYPILSGAATDLARRFGVMGFPALVVVAPDGTIDSVHMGVTSAREIEALLGPLLGARGAAAS